MYLRIGLITFALLAPAVSGAVDGEAIKAAIKDAHKAAATCWDKRNSAEARTACAGAHERVLKAVELIVQDEEIQDGSTGRAITFQAYQLVRQMEGLIRTTTRLLTEEPAPKKCPPGSFAGTPWWDQGSQGDWAKRVSIVFSHTPLGGLKVVMFPPGEARVIRFELTRDQLISLGISPESAVTATDPEQLMQALRVKLHDQTVKELAPTDPTLQQFKRSLDRAKKKGIPLGVERL